MPRKRSRAGGDRTARVAVPAITPFLEAAAVLERGVIDAALAQAGGNVAAAAQLLKLAPSTLRRWLKSPPRRRHASSAPLVALAASQASAVREAVGGALEEACGRLTAAATLLDCNVSSLKTLLRRPEYLDLRDRAAEMRRNTTGQARGRPRTDSP